MDFEKSLNELINSFKNHIIKLKRVCHSNKELKYKLQIYIDSLNITIYSLLQEELKFDEKIQKKNNKR